MARRTPTQRAAERRPLAQNRADIAGRMVGDIEDAARAGDVAATMLLAADLARLAAAEVTERAGGTTGTGSAGPTTPLSTRSSASCSAWRWSNASTSCAPTSPSCRRRSRTGSATST